MSGWMIAICILQWLKDLGPLLLALAVFFATWQFQRWQVRIEKQKLHHDLYDRRFSIYVAFRELLLGLAFMENSDDEIEAAWRKARIALLEVPFLLADSGIQTYLENLCDQVRINVLRNIKYIEMFKPTIETMPSKAKEEYAERWSQLSDARLKMPEEHLAKLSKQFEKFLKLTDFQDGR